MRAPGYQASRGYQPASGLRNPRAWLVSALVLALAASIFLAFAPVAREDTGDLVLDPSGGVVAERDRITLAADDGPWVYLVLLVPVLIAAVPIVRGRSSLVAATWGAVLGGFAIVTGFWAGLYYVPSALLMLIGAWMAELEGRPALIEVAGEQDRYRLGRSHMTGAAGAGAFPVGGRRLEPRTPMREARPAAVREQPPPPAREAAPVQEAPPPPVQEAPPAPVQEEAREPPPEEPPAPRTAPGDRSPEEPRSPWGDEPPARWRRRAG